jgi:hypothetical protein
MVMRYSDGVLTISASLRDCASSELQRRVADPPLGGRGGQGGGKPDFAQGQGAKVEGIAAATGPRAGPPGAPPPPSLSDCTA